MNSDITLETTIEKSDSENDAEKEKDGEKEKEPEVTKDKKPEEEVEKPEDPVDQKPEAKEEEEEKAQANGNVSERLSRLRHLFLMAMLKNIFWSAYRDPVFLASTKGTLFLC